MLAQRVSRWLNGFHAELASIMLQVRTDLSTRVQLAKFARYVCIVK